jgi:hypothetical protein
MDNGQRPQRMRAMKKRDVLRYARIDADPILVFHQVTVGRYLGHRDPRFRISSTKKPH